eukprot:COSAG01_NODE_2490_length_7582_cov_5.100561_4_plen_469_part_00
MPLGTGRPNDGPSITNKTEIRRRVINMAVDTTPSHRLVTVSDSFPEYWGEPTPRDDDLDDIVELEHLTDNSEIMAKLEFCLHPGDPEQLGKGKDASGWNQVQRSRQVKHMRLHKAWRVHNQTLWLSYRGQLQKVAKDLTHVPDHRRQPLELRPEFEDISDLLPGELCDGANERYLMSGVPKDVVWKILMHGMNERYSGGNAGSMFGAGVYFAEDAVKCDQYTRAPDFQSSSDLHDLHAALYPECGEPNVPVNYVFVCRVVMGATLTIHNTEKWKLGSSNDTTHGNVFATKQQRELDEIKDAHRPCPYHSLFADITGVHGSMRFKEIITFNGLRVYPEYLLAYERCGIKKAEATKVQGALRQMTAPIRTRKIQQAREAAAVAKAKAEAEAAAKAEAEAVAAGAAAEAVAAAAAAAAAELSHLTLGMTDCFPAQQAKVHATFTALANTSSMFNKTSNIKSQKSKKKKKKK